MPDLSDPCVPVSALLRAAVLLAARELCAPLRLPQLAVAQILDATGATRSRAYELRDALMRTLPELQRAPGRPAAPAPPAPAPASGATLSREVLRFVMAHPGCVHGGGTRRRYSDALRCFVIDLRVRHAQVPLRDFAQGVQIPFDTLCDWLRSPSPTPPADAAAPSTPVPPSLTHACVETILAQWQGWDGSFDDFCAHVRQHLRIEYGHTLIARILATHGVRRARKRPGRRPDEKALREQFETFFPGAQWVGDGTPLVVQVGAERFACNVELMTDAASGAFVGADVRPHEDSDAVVAALRDGVETTGAPPLAVLLDNFSGNHTQSVHEALGDTLLIAATPARPQNKAHAEGAFGLFSQRAPALVLPDCAPAALARQLVRLVVQTWARTLNHRPRKDRDDRTRVGLYRDGTPTPEQIAQARAALAQRLRKQRLAALTRRARLDPTVRRLLDDAFARLGLQDPNGNLRDAIAAYPHDAVLAAIATFEGKRTAATLPPGADGRYLLGIARNLAHADEGWEIAQALWRLRLDARDHALVQLDAQRARACHDLRLDPFALLQNFVDRALAADRTIDRFFWLQAAVDVAHRERPSRHHDLFRTAARRIHATHRVPHRERLAAARFLAAKLIPLA